MENIDRAREELQEILQQQEYQQYYEDNRNFLQVWWDQMKEWFSEFLADLFSTMGVSSGAANILVILLIGLGILGVGIGVFLSVRSINRKRSLSDHQPLRSMSELTWTVERHVEEAEKKEEFGDYATATRHMFLALLLYFHNHKLLIAKVSKTNWEYVEELHKIDPKRAEKFYEFAQVFDEVVYGERRMLESEYITYRDRIKNWMKQQPGVGLENKGGS